MQLQVNTQSFVSPRSTTNARSVRRNLEFSSTREGSVNQRLNSVQQKLADIQTEIKSMQMEQIDYGNLLDKDENGTFKFMTEASVIEQTTQAETRFDLHP